jgi:hypothetical protein
MIKALPKLGMEGMYLNIIKFIYDKPIANIVLNGEKLKQFPLKSGMSQACPLSPLLFSIVLEFLTRAIRQEEEKKRNTNHANDMILYLKDPKNFTKTLLDTINPFSKVARYKINLQKSVFFLYNNNEKTEKEHRKTTPFTSLKN